MKEVLYYTDPSLNLDLFIDILADMICCYLQAEEASKQADKLTSYPQPDAA